eukprot:TRINITY_DN21103_c0_g1_i1.p1 TRINITY_DN21103_c0_g1~~TRINITY_DN21103_c0_g1_i1.p1  ORF type:complete len:507 (-),score=39.01 TRINITY_DN21103_c0_g1_i1:1271-2791(-)
MINLDTPMKKVGVGVGAVIYILLVAFTLWYTNEVLNTHSSVSPDATFFNWDNSMGCNPANHLIPTTVQEVSSHIRNTKDGFKITPIGATYSFTNAACSDGLLLEMTQLKGIVDVSVESETVTVLAGTTLAELAEGLLKWDMALPVLPRLTTVTVGGAIATGTHGSSTSWGSFSALVEELWIIDGTGEVRHLHKGGDKAERQLFHTSKMGLGVLGVIVQATLKTATPIKKMRRREAAVDIKQALASLASTPVGLSDDHPDEHPTIYWLPHSDASLLIVSTQVETDEEDELKRQSSTVDDFQKEMFHKQFVHRTLQVFSWITSVFPAVTPTLHNTLLQGIFLPQDFMDDYQKVLAWPGTEVYTWSSYTTTEWCVDIKNIEKVFADYRTAIEDNNCLTNFITVITVQKRDTIPLSPAYKRDVACIAFNMAHNEPEFKRCAPKVEDVFMHHGGKPQWFGRIESPREDILALYEESAITRLQKAKEKFDPNTVFTSNGPGQQFLLPLLSLV